MSGFMKSLPILAIVLYDCITILFNEESAVRELAHELDVTVPLTFVFNEFDVLRKRSYSDKAGYD
jgi:hypothetical protein